MVAAPGDPWQALAVAWAMTRAGWLAGVLAASLLAAPASGGAPVAPSAASSPADPRVMSFSWTLHPRMWAEVDLRMEAGAEAIAEVSVEGGEVSWNLHRHPSEFAPETFVTLERGVGRRASVRCAAAEAGWYSYLVGNDAGTGPVRVHIELRLSGEARLRAVKP
jgi:hypothetical protein